MVTSSEAESDWLATIAARRLQVVDSPVVQSPFMESEYELTSIMTAEWVGAAGIVVGEALGESLGEALGAVGAGDADGDDDRDALGLADGVAHWLQTDPPQSIPSSSPFCWLS